MINPSALGYYFDVFFINLPIQVIETQKLLSAIQTALHQFDLRISNVVTKKEFMDNTKSTNINRYVRLPNWFLSNLDDRVFKQTTLQQISKDPGNKESQPDEVVKFDPKNPKELIGAKLESNTAMENAYFHNMRYISCILSEYKEWTAIQVKFNFKLQKALPSIVDATAFTGMTLSHIYHCDGIYARAASFARSEEYFCYIHNGKIMSEEKGNDTCMGYLQPAKLAEMHGISAREFIDNMDEVIGVLYATNDMTEIETVKKHHFQQYDIDTPEIYQKLEAILDNWFSREKRDHHKIVNVIKQMLLKESNVEEKIKAIVPDSNSKEYEEELLKVATTLSEILIARTTIKNLLYKSIEVRDFYVKIDHAAKTSSGEMSNT